MKAALLTIGTEVTDGEITNTNASWLAVTLSDLGFQVVYHLSTPDDEALMLRAMEWLESSVDWVFVTGGLGPTSDDKTRQVVAQWLNAPLEFSEGEWAKLCQLYQNKGLKILEAHRHQCHFPKGARLLENPVGSALGFESSKEVSGSRQLKVAVLPGPPAELQAVFNKGLSDHLAQEIASTAKKPSVLRVWTLLGISESEAAEMAEEHFQQLSGVLLGYRASVPFVHVKAWFESDSCDASVTSEFEKRVEKFLVAKDGADPIEGFRAEVSRFFKVIICDEVTRLHLASRLSEIMTPNQTIEVISGGDLATPSSNHQKEIVLGLVRGLHGVEAYVKHKGYHRLEPIHSPYRWDAESFRGRRFYTEMAFQAWARLLRAISSTSE